MISPPPKKKKKKNIYIYMYKPYRLLSYEILVMKMKYFMEKSVIFLLLKWIASVQ